MNSFGNDEKCVERAVEYKCKISFQELRRRKGKHIDEIKFWFLKGQKHDSIEFEIEKRQWIRNETILCFFVWCKTAK